MADQATDEASAVRPTPLARRALGWLGRALLAAGLLVAALLVFLHTPPGRQFIVDRIAAVAPASGLSVNVGRISGSVLWSATFHDVKFRDADGTMFLEVPEIDLNWRPLWFIFSGLDVRSLVLHEGVLQAVPKLNPSPPDTPILPDFDIRVDRLLIDDLRVAKGLLGEERLIDFRAKFDVRRGKVLLDAGGDLGGADKFDLLVDSEPDRDRFDIDLDYRAPKGGLLATLVGAKEDLRARIDGQGSWARWDGTFDVRKGGRRYGDFIVRNRSGTYTLAGRVRPGSDVTGIAARALGPAPGLAVVGRLEDSVVTGSLALKGSGLSLSGQGSVDLADNALDGVRLSLRKLDPELLGEGIRLEGVRLVVTLDGPFRALRARHELDVARADLSGTVLTGLRQRGTLAFDGSRVVIPLDASVARVATGSELLDPRLVQGTLKGALAIEGDRLLGDDLRLAFPGLTSRLSLRGDLAKGGYAVAGPVELRGFEFAGVGTIDAGAKIVAKIGNGVPWSLAANFTGRMPKVTSQLLEDLAGTGIRFDGNALFGANQPIRLREASLAASKLSLSFAGEIDGNRATFAGEGRHRDYGRFTGEAGYSGAGPRAELVFANPLPVAGLRDVRLAISPAGNGLRVETKGQSALGPFDGLLKVNTTATGPTQIEIDRLSVWKTAVTGTMTLRNGLATGNLRLAGGGLDGTIGLSPLAGDQAFRIDLVANDASFGGTTPLSIRRAEIAVGGVFGGKSNTLRGTAQAQGVSYGPLFLGRFTGRAEVIDGVGRFDASLGGRRGSRFDLQLTGDMTAERIAAAAKGSYGGRAISMPRRAVLRRQSDGGWQLQQTQLNFGRGVALAEGRFGGTGGTSGTMSFSKMPLTLIDLALTEAAFGGTLSGIVEFSAGPGRAPTGEARVMIDGLTRSGLLLTSRPTDVALVVQLSPTALQARANISDDSGTRGSLQGRITNLARDGGLYERLQDGNLAGQLRYAGPADALWRLIALDSLDINGPLSVAVDARGSLRSPQVRGTLSGDALRVESVLSGIDVRQVKVRGQFSGSRLQLASFAGKTPNGGTVSGSGMIDLANLGPGRGPEIDIRLAARNAALVDLAHMGATVTGPLRIVSDGVGGTVAGRLQASQARWRLGRAAAAAALPDIRTRETNLPADAAPAGAAGRPWRYLVDIRARDGVKVDGMGLDSEWSADLQLRGTTASPRIGGAARIVPRRGFYSFAGTRFEISRGVINFDVNAPPDPRIGLLAQTQVDGLAVRINISGRATKPEVDFESTPSLPQEEVLARLLFGGSIANLSATDALQLGSALAGLKGGAGLDPINKLRTAVGLDRLRLVPADPALDRGTALALGKRFGRRFYGELVTDGRGYNATEVEFRISSWLALLATVSSLGREGVSLRYSKDY